MADDAQGHVVQRSLIHSFAFKAPNLQNGKDDAAFAIERRMSTRNGQELGTPRERWATRCDVAGCKGQIGTDRDAAL